MISIKFTLISDGSSDAVLLKPIEWLLAEKGIANIDGSWANLSIYRNPPRDLTSKIERTLELNSPDILFIHRDSEREQIDKRAKEILRAHERCLKKACFVCVIPVRMQEAWLLFDEKAIRKAAGNDNGKISLSIPKLKNLEESPNPKRILHDNLKKASGLNARRMKKFKVDEKVHRLAELIEDYSPLRKLPAFQRFEQDLDLVLGCLRHEQAQKKQ